MACIVGACKQRVAKVSMYELQCILDWAIEVDDRLALA